MAYRPTIARTLDGGIVAKDHYTVDPAATFSAGALVYFDPATQLVKVVPTDGVLVLGMAMESAADAIAGNGSGPAGKVLVAIFTSNTVIRLKGSTTPVVAHLFVATGYAITAAATTGIPTLDLTDTTNVLLKVIQIDVDKAEFECTVKGLCIQANLVIS